MKMSNGKFGRIFISSSIKITRNRNGAMKVATTGFALGINRVWRRYLYYLDRYPGYTQSLNTCLLMGAGDFIAQWFVEDRRTFGGYDFRRTARFAFVGLAVAGPAMTVWYRALDRTIKGGTKASMTLRKTFLDQAFFLPVYLVGFVAVMGALRWDGPREIEERLRRDLKPMLVTSYGVWPAVQVANFYLLPLRHRVFAINVVCLFWNAYIAWKAEKDL